MELKIPKQVKEILLKLESSGFEAYIVGGCVRDILMGIKPNDWDICTSARPDQVVKTFESDEVLLTGVKHGTVTVVLDRVGYEITTFRNDGKYSDGRHPDCVSYSNSIVEDLKRRDFTINSIAYNPKTGFIDLFGGMEDIKNKIVRCVGNPCDRFNEDYLRMLRAVRFSIKYGMTIDEKTEAAIWENKEKIKNVSFERIQNETIKALSLGYSYLLGSLIKVVVPIVENDTLMNLGILNVLGGGLYSKLSALFNFDKKIQSSTLKKLRFDNKTIKRVSNVSTMADDIYSMISYNTKSDTTILRVGLNIDDSIIEEALSLVKYHSMLNRRFDIYDKAKSLYSSIPKAKKLPYKICHLDIDGNDLKEFGFNGKRIGQELKTVLRRVILEELENNKDAITHYIQRCYLR